MNQQVDVLSHFEMKFQDQTVFVCMQCCCAMLCRLTPGKAVQDCTCPETFSQNTELNGIELFEHTMTVHA